MMNFNAVQQFQQQAMIGAMGMGFAGMAAAPPPPPPGGQPPQVVVAPQQQAGMNPFLQNQYTPAFGQIAVNSAPPVQPMPPAQPPPPVSVSSWFNFLQLSECDDDDSFISFLFLVLKAISQIAE
mgnify:FL=1